MDTKTKPDIADLTPQELRTKILVSAAAKMNGLSESTFRKHYGHLIRKLTPRLHRVELIDAITLPPAPPKEGELEAKAQRRGKRVIGSRI
jgi:hypothetical protein